MFKRTIFPHILAMAVVVTLLGTLPALAQRGGFRGGSVGGFRSGGGAFHGGGSFGGFHQGGSFNTFHGGGVNHFHHGGFGGYYGSHYYHGGYYGYPYHGGYYGHPYYYGGYYGYPGYGFSIGFGFGPFWGYWGYPYGYGYYPAPYPYGPYHDPSHPADDRNDSSDPPEQDRESRYPAADKPSRCDYRYEDTCNAANDEQVLTPPSNTKPSSGPPDMNYVTAKGDH